MSTRRASPKTTSSVGRELPTGRRREAQRGTPNGRSGRPNALAGAVDGAPFAGEDQPTGADRVLATLKVLAGRPEGAGLHDLARQLASPKSSVHRALAALRRAGLVDQDRSGRYWVGWELLHLAFDYYEHLDNVNRVRPALVALSERFGETVHYATLEGAEVIYQAKVQPPTSLFHMCSSVGGRNPAHCTGVGKAILAFELNDRAAVGCFVAEHGPLVALTANTIVDAEALHKELAATRRRGYGLDREERELGVVCLGVPVFFASTTVPAGAISIAVVAHRTPLHELQNRAGEIREIIRRELGDVLR
jgi:IclR family transcriptional regulator, acetate operon repressor